MRSFPTEAVTIALGAGLILAACQSDGSLDDDDAASTGSSAGTGGARQAGATTSDGAGQGGAATSSEGGSTPSSTSASGGAGGTGGSGTGGTGTGAVGGGPTSSSTATSTSSSSSTGGGPVTYDNCGFPNDGPWMEIDYGSAYTVTNPSRTYSNTPGYGEAQWTPTGQSYPEVWLIGGGGTQVSNDPIGKIASVGPGARLQLMIGLGSLISYSHATVCVEGRSVSTSASVLFDAYNPKNNCGAGGQMSHSWAIHATGVDMGQCLIAGDAFQAVRLEPWGGSSHLGVRRVRITLHDATF